MPVFDRASISVALDRAGFTFATERERRAAANCFHVRLPGDIMGMDELLGWLRGSLWLPVDAGFGWEALHAGLHDLSWMSDRTVVIEHERLPRLASGQLRTYLGLLRDAVGFWSSCDDRRLDVIFPERDRAEVEGMLARLH